MTGNELTAYLIKFERIMKECEIMKGDWADRLFARLPDKLCERVAELRDEGADYDKVKRVLLRAVGETAITYGAKLLEITMESSKHKTGCEVTDYIIKVWEGLMQGCETKEEVALAYFQALSRKILPPEGRTYMENKAIKTRKDWEDAWADWQAGRKNGDYTVPMGSPDVISERKPYRSEGYRGGGSERDRNYTPSICYNCGMKGHRAPECRKPRAGYKPRPYTCYHCGKEGHRSFECTAKKGGNNTEKETPPKRISVMEVKSSRKSICER